MRRTLVLLLLLVGPWTATADDSGPVIAGTVRRAGVGIPAQIEVRRVPFDLDLEWFPEVSSESVLVRGRAGASGSYRVRVPTPGRYEVSAIAENGAIGVAQAQVLARELVASLDVEVPPGALDLRGRMRRPDGSPYVGRIFVTHRLPDESVWVDSVLFSAVETDAEGRFTVHGLPAGVVGLRPARSGLYEQAPRARVAVPRTTPIEVLALDEPPVDERPAPWSVEGRVSDREGHSLVGVVVRLAGEADPRDVTTGADGAYRFADVRGWFADVWVNDPAWVSEERADAVGSFGYQPFRVGAPGDGTATRDLVAVPAAALNGRVVDADGKGVAGALVTPSLGEDFGRPDSTGVATSSDGSFALAGLVAGLRYDVVARAPGFQPAHVRAKASTESSPLELRLPPERWAEVRVYDEATGRGIPHAVLAAVPSDCVDEEDCALLSWDNPRPRAWFTDEQGRARVGPLWGGTWWLRTAAEGWFTERELVYLPPGGTPEGTPIRIPMQRGRALKVRVLLPEGLDERTLAVTAYGLACGRTDEPGTWGIDGLPLGPVVVRAEGTLKDRTFSGRVVANAQSTEVVLSLEPVEPEPKVPGLDVHLLDAQGEPRELGTTLLLTRYDDGSTAIDRDWEEVKVPSEPTRVTEAWLLADAKGSDGISAPTWAGPIKSLSGPIRVTLDTARSIEGRVLGPSGEGIRALRVKAVPASGPPGFDGWVDAHGDTVTGAEGRFRFESLGRMAYRIDLDVPTSWGQVSSRWIAAHDGSTVVFRLAPAQERSVRILDADGHSLTEGRVWCSSGMAASISPDSTATLSRLAADEEYVLTVTGTNEHGAWMSLTQWKPGTPEIRTVPAVTFRGVIRRPSGASDPITSVRGRAKGGGWKGVYPLPGEDGRFTAGPVPAGPVEVQVALGEDRWLPVVSGTTEETIEVVIPARP